MTVILRVGEGRAGWWKAHLQSLMPDLPVRLWDEPGDDDAIRYAVVWRPPPGGLKRFANLECIVSIGAGVDHVLCDPELPPGVPIIRTVGDQLLQRMREYVCLAVLRCHRRLPELEQAQRERRWHQIIEPPANECPVGVMGLGAMGGLCAEALAHIGFDVAGWSRTPRRLPGITTYAGPEQLGAFLARSRILVCLLPLTPLTRDILDAALFAKLPAGAHVINVGRGPLLVEADLLAALDAGHLAGATLDVFRTEPLPPDHPFWPHPKVLVTPHVGSLIDPESGGRLIADNLARFRAGEPVPDMVDLAQGY